MDGKKKQKWSLKKGISRGNILAAVLLTALFFIIYENMDRGIK